MRAQSRMRGCVHCAQALESVERVVDRRFHVGLSCGSECTRNGYPPDDRTDRSHLPTRRGNMSSKAKNIAVWIASVLLALEYAFAGITKLSGQEEGVQGFRNLGYGDNFRLFIGAAEVAGAIGLLVPRLRGWAAAGLTIIMI